MNRVSRIVTQFQTYDETLEHKIVVRKILWCLTKKFAMVVTTIEEAKYISNFNLEELIGSLLSHEVWFNQEEESLTNAFSTQASLNRGRGRGGRGRGRRGRGSPTTEDRTSHSHENSKHLEHSHNSQGQRGEARDGPISPMFSVTTARSMGTMNKNVERSKRTRTITRTIAEPMSPKKKKARQRWCFCLIKQLKNNVAQIYGY